MDLRDFVALYVTETREHLRLLDKALLAVERGEVEGAIDEAFRAAHTLKGLSATMGFRSAADQAHALEDRLHRVRTGELRVDADIIDSLLAAADDLGRVIDHAVATEEPRVDGWEGPDDEERGPFAVGASEPADGAQVESGPASAQPVDPDQVSVRVVLRSDAPVKAARAMLVVRAVEQRWRVARTEPAVFDDSFGGELRIMLDSSADRAELETAIRGAGEVELVIFEDAASARPLARAEQPVVEAPRVVQVRVDQRRLDEIADGIGELSLLERRLRRELGEKAGNVEAVGRLSALLSDLQHAVLSVRMVPLAEAFERFPRVVRDAARRADKEIEFRIEGEGIEIDRSILDDVVDPLIHLLRNAVDHGIEAEEERVAAGKPARGTIVLRAERARASVRIALEDDGRGVNRARVLEKARLAGLHAEADAAAHDDDALLRLMAHPGLSTSDEVTELSGRGVGMDVVLSRVRALGGAIDMRTEPGHGTTFTLRLPITLALARALLVRVDDEEYAVPLTHISEAIELDGAIERRNPGGEYVKLRDESLPLVRMTRVLGSRHVRTERAAIVAELGQRKIALGFDEIVGHEQILVKTFDAAAGTLPIFSGATLLADGRPALVLDPLSVI